MINNKKLRALKKWDVLAKEYIRKVENGEYRTEYAQDKAAKEVKKAWNEYISIQDEQKREPKRGRPALGVTRKVSITLPVEMWEEIQSIQEQDGMSLSQTLREIVDVYMNIGDISELNGEPKNLYLCAECVLKWDEQEKQNRIDTKEEAL